MEQEENSMTSESSSLLVDTVNRNFTSPGRSSSSAQHVCLPSKAAIIILLWTAVVGIIIYYFYLESYAAFLLLQPHSHIFSILHDSLPYAILAFVMMFYPLSGFIADVCCGRLKTVVVSLVFLLISYILSLLGVLVLATVARHISLDDSPTQKILVAILLSFAALIFVIGLAGYQANFIQLGVDHLFEAPSRYLSLFIHYATLAFKLFSVLVLLFTMLLCLNGTTRRILFTPLLLLLTLLFVVLLCVSIWKRKWFCSEPGCNNPYKTVYDVIKFVKNHKHPLQRSAFTYSDNYIPSRLDFAKERYDGPFSTEQVENVKTFFRILLVLFAVGPVFSMEVLESSFLFPVIGVHTLNHVKNAKDACAQNHVLKLILESGSVKDIASTMILFPVYIWVILFLLRRKVPKLFLRLGVGILFCLLGVVSFLIVDIMGHSMNRNSDINHTQCMICFKCP